MKSKTIRTAQEVRNEFIYKGISMASWAKKNGFDKATVSQVLSGQNTAIRGKGHAIAVLLGLKAGVIVNDTEE